MIKKTIPALFIFLLLLTVGCTQKEPEKATPTTQIIEETAEAEDTTIEANEIPLLEENDSVEIGEMI